MTNHTLLNNVAHKDLRIIRTHSAQYGDDTMAAMTFPAEFREIQAHYPIVFTKSQEGAFTPVALFGFREKQNLFLGADGWNATYVPLMVQRQPFLIGATPDSQKVIHVDLDDPRVSRTEGEPVFREHGGNSEYLDHIASVLATIHQGAAVTPHFVAAIMEHNLLESFVLDIQLGDGAEHRFAGFYTIQEERLAKLDGAALARLHEKGYLQAIFMVVASLANFRDLIARVSRLNADQR